MAEASYIGAYWGPRAETLDTCAENVAQLLDGLREVHPLLSTWFRRGRSRRAGLEHQVDPSATVMREMMLARPKQRGDDVEPAGLGYSVDLWNGQDAAVGFSVTCGAWVDSPRMSSNTLVLELPAPEGEALELYRRTTAIACVRSIVAMFSPSWATYSNNTLSTPQLPQQGRVIAGWATYVADPNLVTVSKLPASVTVETFGPGLLMLAEGDIDTVSPADVVMVRDAIAMPSVG